MECLTGSPQSPQWCGHSPRVRHPGVWKNWALRDITRNKASGGDRIQAELFQIVKDGESAALNMKQIWKTQRWLRDWKRSVFIPIPKTGNVKECSNYHTIALISHAVAPYSSTLAWKIPWTEEPGRLQSMGSLRVRHDWASSLSLFTFMHWRGNGNHSSVLAWRIPGMGESGGLPSMGLHRVRHDWSDLAAT